MDIIKNFEEILKAGQDNAILRFGLGQAYLQQESFDLAKEHLSKALEYDKNYSAAWKLLGKACSKLDDTAAAIDAYENGIRVAEKKGDKQAAKEMSVFLKRLKK